MSSADHPVSAAISIPDDSFSSDSDDSSGLPGTPGARPGAESWQPVPPPMLASSLDARFRPSPRAAHTPSLHPPPSYGAIAVDTAASSHHPHHSRHPRKPPLSRRSAAVTPPSRSTTLRTKINRLFVQLGLMRAAPRELWIIFALKFLSSFAYFSLTVVLTMYLTDEFGLSDTAAGWAYGAYGVMSTLFGLICGWFIDYLGVRASLLVGSLIGAFARFIMAVTTSRHAAIIMLYTLLPFSECLGIPIMTIGIKRYTNSTNRTFAFSLFYSMMNLAALIAGPLVDYWRAFFDDGLIIHLALLGHDVRLTGLRVIILTSAISTALMCFVVLIGIREINVDESGNLAAFVPNRESPFQQTLIVLRDPAFWRLTVFTLLLVGVRMVFRHLDATMPKYLVRQFGPTAPFGLIYAINPFLIIIFVPIIGLITRHVDSFSMILYGSFVSAASPFWLCVKQSYLGVVLFMATLSVGEAVYSPRVFVYTMEVSAHGSEGLYSSLSLAPLFSVKLLVGGMSGWLLTEFMPANGPHHGNVLWGIIGLSSMTSPILMWLLKDYISPSSESEEPQPPSDELFNQSRMKKPPMMPDAIVSAARPPICPSADTRMAVPSDEDDGAISDDERPLASSFSRKPPLSVSPASSSHLPRTRSVTRHSHG